MNQLVQVLRSLLEKAIEEEDAQVTVDESVSSSDYNRSYSDQQEDSADEKSCASYEMSCDDISLDVITISSWLSADEAKRKRRCDVVLRFSR
ncbi:hypothetical protein F511_45736 [Dorcoceras hygrometricum]|uniref:Uncharacterized protein n=1 Tax=Dorcoceras hygrometricum TaxID=472368 RepID=A0A2Z7A2W4_9LAMI|nr:hypothetical protein F511_45736 [Dorcoceras hygrometricum]